eukprot:TRINITY_DN1061_c0_g1_i3.p1 TRINITY_DN1061_c0_g1~~TRINITY_DN1061_c0_g1_i3.p1  ORF type:complete len:677 (+),score=240.28 TRINITY_DN1061_c0_g1_i3:50-2080(+)
MASIFSRISAAVRSSPDVIQAESCINNAVGRVTQSAAQLAIDQNLFNFGEQKNKPRFKRYIQIFAHSNPNFRRRKLSFLSSALDAFTRAIESVTSSLISVIECLVIVDNFTEKVLSAIDPLGKLQKEKYLNVANMNQDCLRFDGDCAIICFIRPTRESLETFLSYIDGLTDCKNFHLFVTSVINPEFEEQIQNHNRARSVVRQIRILNIDIYPYEDEIFYLDCPLENYINYLTPGPNFSQSVPELAIRIFSSLKLLDIHETATVRYIKNSQMATELGTELQRIIDQNTPENLIDSTEKQTVLIVDRNFDLGTLFAHDPSYESLIFDNKIFCPISRQPLKLELMPDDKPTFLKDEVDPLWKRYRHLPINQMIKLIGGDLTHWEKANEHIIKYENGEVKENLSTKELRDIAQQLPIYEKEKRQFAMHSKLGSVLEKDRKVIMETAKIEMDIQANTKALIGSGAMINRISALISTQSLSKDHIIRILCVLAGVGGKEYMDTIKNLGEQAGLDHHAIEVIRLLANNIPNVTSQRLSKFAQALGFQSSDNLSLPEKQETELFGSLRCYSNGFRALINSLVKDRLEVDLYPYAQPHIMHKVIEKKKLNLLNARISHEPLWARKEKRLKKRWIMLFVIGGITYFDIRIATELSNSYEIAVLLGSTNIIIPNAAFTLTNKSIKI